VTQKTHNQKQKKPSLNLCFFRGKSLEDQRMISYPASGDVDVGIHFKSSKSWSQFRFHIFRQKSSFIWKLRNLGLQVLLVEVSTFFEKGTIWTPTLTAPEVSTFHPTLVSGIRLHGVLYFRWMIQYWTIWLSNRLLWGMLTHQLNESKRDMFVFAGYHRLTMFNYDDS